jgi:hypothetical protein
MPKLRSKTLILVPTLLTITTSLGGCHLYDESWRAAKDWPKALVSASLDPGVEGRSVVVADFVYGSHEIRRVRFEIGEAARVEGEFSEREGALPGQPLFDAGRIPSAIGQARNEGETFVYQSSGSTLSYASPEIDRNLVPPVEVRWDSGRAWMTAAATPVLLIVDVVCSPIYLWWEVSSWGVHRERFLPWCNPTNHGAFGPECDEIARAARGD